MSDTPNNTNHPRHDDLPDIPNATDMTVKIHRGRPSKWVLLAIVLLVLAIASVSLVYKKHADKQAGNGPSTTGSNSKTTPVTKEQQAYDTAIVQSQKLDVAGNYSDEIKVLQAYLAANPGGTAGSPTGSPGTSNSTGSVNNPSNGQTGGQNPGQSTDGSDYVIEASIQLGSAYLNNKDYPNALVWYQKTLELSDTPSRKMAAIHGLALTYKGMGDKPAAIAQYKAAIAIAQTTPDDDQALRIISVDTTAITQLGGTP